MVLPGQVKSFCNSAAVPGGTNVLVTLPTVTRAMVLCTPAPGKLKAIVSNTATQALASVVAWASEPGAVAAVVVTVYVSLRGPRLCPKYKPHFPNGRQRENLSAVGLFAAEMAHRPAVRAEMRIAGAGGTCYPKQLPRLPSLACALTIARHGSHRRRRSLCEEPWFLV
jgi:hypothetical protein